MKLLLISSISMLLLFSFVSIQAKGIYPFANIKQKKQFNVLTQQLRCLVCQNESLSDSNADLAKDLKNKVYQMVLSGKNNQQIKDYMLKRYGNFILFKPQLIQKTYVLWFAPFLLLLIAFLIVWRLVLQSNKRSA